MLIVEKLLFAQDGRWGNIENRRQFLFAFAEKMGFDPTIRENWKGMGPKVRNHKVWDLLVY